MNNRSRNIIQIKLNNSFSYHTIADLKLIKSASTKETKNQKAENKTGLVRWLPKFRLNRNKNFKENGKKHANQAHYSNTSITHQHQLKNESLH